MFTGKRRGSIYVVVVCRYCGTMTAVNAGSSPVRPGPCIGDRPPPERIVWAARRTEATARYFWALRGR